jgi:TatD DNase family protein
MSKNIDVEIVKYPDLIALPWLDIHTHLNFLENSPEEAIATAKSRGVRSMITIGTEPGDLPTVLGIARKHYPVVLCTLGIHPHEAGLFTAEIDAFIRKEAVAKEVVAIGEIGLDYFYKNSEPEVQKKAFEQQLQIACDLGLPVEIHTRDADEDTVEILKKFKGRVKGVLHCFTGTRWLAEQALDLGFNISISGVVTFKNAESLREIVEFLPLDRIHVETDAPFLTPAPFRGVKNSPQYVVFVAQFVADLKKVPLSQLSEQLIKNAQAMFPKWPLQQIDS